MSGGARGSNDPPEPEVPEWLWATHDAIQREGRSRLAVPEPPSGQQRWHHALSGGYRAPNPPPPPTAKHPGPRRSRSPARQGVETRVFGPETEGHELLNDIAERLKTAYFSLGRALMKFNPHHHTLVVCGRPVQALHHTQTRIVLLPVCGPPSLTPSS